jgi:predicted lipoprotein with Yx(FWY)xxD motif
VRTPSHRPVRSRRNAAAAVALGLIVSLALAATGLGSQSSSAVVKMRKTSLGTILVNAQGRTLYMFEKDKGSKSACAGRCATFWPPLVTTGKPKAGSGVKAPLLGTTRRTDGRLQVTYNKHPLYRFVQDTKAGQTKGEEANAFGGEWYAVSPKGAKVEKPSSGGGYGGGYGK